MTRVLIVVLFGCWVEVSFAEPFGGRWRGSSFASPFAFRNSFYISKDEVGNVWRSTGTVPDKTLEVPEQLLDLRFGNTKIYINGTYDADQTLTSPTAYWDADPDALYTFMLEDEDIDFLPIKLMHMMVTNIRGTNFATGDQVYALLPPFTINLNEDQTGLDTTLAENGGHTHRYIALVYKQKGLINIPDKPGGCSDNILRDRVSDHAKLKEEYELEGPVAGTFFKTGHSRSGWTEFFICKYTRCMGNPVPVGPLPGVNDLPECQKLD